MAFGHNEAECYQHNWLDKLEIFQKLLDCWRLRDLTLFGKVTVIKTLGISKLVSSATCCCVTNDTIKDINKLIYNFLWHKTDRIKRNVLINNYEDGGINMLDTESFFNALKASWVKRLNDAGEASWTLITMQYFITSNKS